MKHNKVINFPAKTKTKLNSLQMFSLEMFQKLLSFKAFFSYNMTFLHYNENIKQ